MTEFTAQLELKIPCADKDTADELLNQIIKVIINFDGDIGDTHETRRFGGNFK